MNIVQLLATAIRVLGIYLLVITLMELWHYGIATSFLEASLADKGALLDTSLLIWSSGFILAALVMLIFPTKLALWLVPGDAGQETTVDVQPKELEVSAFVIVGVVLLAGAIPDIIYNGIWLWYQNTGQINDRLTVATNEEYIINLVITLVEVGIGLYLTFGAAGLQKLLYKIRRGGIN